MVILDAVKIYTRGGDRGETALFGGERVSKTHDRVQAFGDVDELNALLGTVTAELSPGDLRDWLVTIQSSLFDLGSELATPKSAKASAGPTVDAQDIAALEGWIDALDGELPPLRSFILPGGTRAAALLHLARTVCRRAERSVVDLALETPVSDAVLAYLNRLSDLLFTMARAANCRAGAEEQPWVGRER